MPLSVRLCCRRRRSVMARNGAEPVPVQIITILASGSFGIRKVVPNGRGYAHFVTAVQVAHVAGAYALDRISVLILVNTLDGEGDVVVSRPFPVAGARH